MRTSKSNSWSGASITDNYILWTNATPKSRDFFLSRFRKKEGAGASGGSGGGRGYGAKLSRQMSDV